MDPDMQVGNLFSFYVSAANCGAEPGRQKPLLRLGPVGLPNALGLNQLGFTHSERKAVTFQTPSGKATAWVWIRNEMCSFATRHYQATIFRRLWDRPEFLTMDMMKMSGPSRACCVRLVEVEMHTSLVLMSPRQNQSSVLIWLMCSVQNEEGVMWDDVWAPHQEPTSALNSHISSKGLHLFICLLCAPMTQWAKWSYETRRTGPNVFLHLQWQSVCELTS